MFSRFHSIWKARSSLRGFTLIELLIVIAIILILIAIALPNFLEAQVRARVANAKGALRTVEIGMNSHLIDYGCIPADFNDSAPIRVKCRARKAINGPCTMTANCNFGGRDGGLVFDVDRCTFYANNLHCPLTSPIRYLQPNETVDTFSDGTVPIGFDSREINHKIIYGAFFAAGPDKHAGQWIRGAGITTPDGCPKGLPYSPTNGTTSFGEFWGVVGDWGAHLPGAGVCENAQGEYGVQRTY
jgi:prepilin-type N-terminal cleavage/methylation domain-containing protein